jgi:hypothetical protein
MSADNGIIVRKVAPNKFKVLEYCASSGSIMRTKTFKTLEEALDYGTKQDTEYGITYEGEKKKEGR